MALQVESGNDYPQRSSDKFPFAWRHRDLASLTPAFAAAPVLDLVFELPLGAGIHPLELYEHLQELHIPEKAPGAAFVEPIKLKAPVLNFPEQIRDGDVRNQKRCGKLDPRTGSDRRR